MAEHSPTEHLVKIPRLTKSKVQYREAEGDDRCGNCRFYIGAYTSCSIVEGRIEPGDTCEQFKAVRSVSVVEPEPETTQQPVVVETEQADGWKVVSLKTKQVLGSHESKELAERQAAYFKKTEVKVVRV